MLTHSLQEVNTVCALWEYSVSISFTFNFGKYAVDLDNIRYAKITFKVV